MNTITFKQLDTVVRALETRTVSFGLPIYHSVRILNAAGDEWNEVDEADAIYAEIYLCDYKGEHDYTELDSLLQEVDVKIDRSAMLAPFAVDRYLSDEDKAPCAWLVEGDGECGGEYCRIWGYSLLLRK